MENYQQESKDFTRKLEQQLIKAEQPVIQLIAC